MECKSHDGNWKAVAIVENIYRKTENFGEWNLPKFNQSIYPNKHLFYEDVKQFTKVYFVNAVAICQSFSLSKFMVLWYRHVGT